MFDPRERRSWSLFRERRRTLARRRLAVERLEPHVLLSTFMVTKTVDDGSGDPHTLSWAIAQVNNDPNDSAASPDAIDFSRSRTGPQTLTENIFLSPILSPVFIDGASQQGYTGTPLITLDDTYLSLSAGAADRHNRRARCSSPTGVQGQGSRSTRRVFRLSGTISE